MNVSLWSDPIKEKAWNEYHVIYKDLHHSLCDIFILNWWVFLLYKIFIYAEIKWQQKNVYDNIYFEILNFRLFIQSDPRVMKERLRRSKFLIINYLYNCCVPFPIKPRIFKSVSKQIVCWIMTQLFSLHRCLLNLQTTASINFLCARAWQKSS